MDSSVKNSLHQNLNFDVDWSVRCLSIYGFSSNKAYALVDKILSEIRYNARKMNRDFDENSVFLSKLDIKVKEMKNNGKLISH